MLVHSYIYYWMNSNIIDDYTWQKWADELVELQKTKKNIGWYDTAFKDWDSSTGCHLPTDEWVRSKATYILNIHDSMDNST